MQLKIAFDCLGGHTLRGKKLIDIEKTSLSIFKLPKHTEINCDKKMKNGYYYGCCFCSYKLKNDNDYCGFCIHDEDFYMEDFVQENGLHI